MQFYCPQGHLLECAESQGGQRSRCPTCYVEFIVPVATDAAAESAPGAASTEFAPTNLAAPSFTFGPLHDRGETDQGSVTDEGLPVVCRPAAIFAEATRDGAPDAQRGAWRSEPGEQERLLHIPCPAGHELETPESMIGQDVLCPYCRAEFRLQFKDSREFRAQQEQERLRREQQIGKAWMTWSLVTAAVVICGIALMIAVATSN